MGVATTSYRVRASRVSDVPGLLALRPGVAVQPRFIVM